MHTGALLKYNANFGKNLPKALAKLSSDVSSFRALPMNSYEILGKLTSLSLSFTSLKRVQLYINQDCCEDSIS